MEHVLDTRDDTTDEPVGIVISGGSLPEPAPRFWAYVWGQDDEPGIPAGLTTAA
jgi:hypothetical protein